MAVAGSTWKRLLNGLGTVLAVAGVAFVGIRFHAYGKEIDFSHLGGCVWVVAGIAAVAYAGANLLLAAAWRDLLGRMATRVKALWAIKVYGISQLAKYVPGNIFHFAGRQALGMADGVPGWVLAKSSAWELGLLVLAGIAYSGLASPLAFAWPIAAGLGIFIATVALMAWVLGRGFGRLCVRAWVCHLVFLGISGSLFIWLLMAIAPAADGRLWPSLCAAYVLAWLAGLVTPGAPAGVGVRELILLFLMHGLFSQADLLLAVVVGRVVTVAGDAIFFLVATLLTVKADTATTH